jgi:hypothetical protein
MSSKSSLSTSNIDHIFLQWFSQESTFLEPMGLPKMVDSTVLAHLSGVEGKRDGGVVCGDASIPAWMMQSTNLNLYAGTACWRKERVKFADTSRRF